MKKSPEIYILYFDGSSIGNPGPSGAAYIIEGKDGSVISEKGFSVGYNTNNVSEYLGLIEGLKKAKELGFNNIILRTDSKLVTHQLKGEYRIRAEKIIPLFKEAKKLLSNFNWSVEKISRKENKRVDQLAFASAKSKK